MKKQIIPLFIFLLLPFSSFCEDKTLQIKRIRYAHTQKKEATKRPTSGTYLGKKVKQLMAKSNNSLRNRQYQFILQIKREIGDPKFHNIWENVKFRKSPHYKEYFPRYEQITTNIRKKIYNYFRKTTEESRRNVKKQIKALGGEIVGEIITTNCIIGRLPVKNIKHLKDHSLIQGIYRDQHIEAQLDTAVSTIHTSPWWKSGYNGSQYKEENAIEVAVLDTGVNESHPSFRGKVIDSHSFVWNESVTDSNGHGTHVAGIIASTDNEYRGVAYGVNLLNGKCMNEYGAGRVSSLMEAAEWAVIDTSDPAEVISTSLVIPHSQIKPDGDSIITRFVDIFTTSYKVTWCTAAGNFGMYGRETISPPADAYNSITVGATYDRQTIIRKDDLVAAYSARGPTSDGRIKPDIVAPGTNIKSSNAGYKSGNNWNEKTGTSMATPMVAGSAAILFPYIVNNFNFTNPHLALKAILLNTAQNMTEPRDKQGFGYLDLKKVWNTRHYIRRLNISKGKKEYYVTLKRGEKFKASFVRYRPLEPYPSEESNSYQLSDIDFKLKGDEGEVIANSMVTHNSVEKIETKIEQSETYRLIVDPKKVTQKEQVLALASSAPLTPFKISIKYNKTVEKVISERPYQIEAVLTNLNNRTFHNLTMNLALPQKLKITSAPSDSHINYLHPNNSWRVSWKIKPITTGNFSGTLYLTLDELASTIKLLINFRLDKEKEQKKLPRLFPHLLIIISIIVISLIISLIIITWQNEKRNHNSDPNKEEKNV